MGITALSPALVSDGKDLALFGVTTLKNALDGWLGKAEVVEPKISGDGLQAVEDAITAHAPVSVQSTVRFALGLVGSYAGNAKIDFDTRAIAALHLASASVDHAYNVLSGKLAPPT